MLEKIFTCKNPDGLKIVGYEIVKEDTKENISSIICSHGFTEI